MRIAHCVSRTQPQARERSEYNPRHVPSHLFCLPHPRCRVSTAARRRDDPGTVGLRRVHPGRKAALAGKALLDLVTAVGGKSLAPILAGLTPGQAASYQDTDSTAAENLASAKDLLSFRLPQKPKVTGGEIMADDFVVLEVEGTQFEMRNLYLVEMRLVGGKWKYDASFTAGILR